MNFLSFIFGDANKRYIENLEPTIKRIGDFDFEFEKLSDNELKEMTQNFKDRFKKGETLNDILPEAFALVREAAKRTLNMRHFDVQLMGGIVLHQGKIAEMRTGEGKTLAATLPAYLNALNSRGVHIITVNDYLSRRDAVWMGQIYDLLGITVGCINHESAFLYDSKYGQHQDREKEKILDRTRDSIGNFRVVEDYLRPASRKDAYDADILYGTNNEFGFDYLKDNMAYDAGQMVQRGHYFAIVDEIDSILIDEARTPLIISAPDEESAVMYDQFAKIVPRLKENIDFNVDEKMRAIALTDEGITDVEKILGIKNIYDPDLGATGLRYVHHLEQALRAQILFKKDRDYVVKDGEVIIVDEFTGRLMPGRRYSEGLHQAIEAKENVRVQKESRTLATITFQNYFRMYEKLSGMTGTAATSAEEFYKVYKLDVITLPTNKQMLRVDLRDQIFQSETGKFQAVVREIKKRAKEGQPVLVGTVSIEKNEQLSDLLRKEGILHEVLNAKNHEREAEIIAQAGKIEAVTIATNMAGRGVDIILGGNPQNEEDAKKVRELGGLFVIGTERHEARRIDNQLRGRAGRQGDSGSSQFFISLEDDLMRIFGSEKIKNLMARLGVPESQPIENSMVSRAIESAQSKIEGHHFDSRNYVLKYDEVMSKHRDAIYRLRKEILISENLKEKNMAMAKEELNRIITTHTFEGDCSQWNIEEMFEDMKVIFGADIEDLIGKLREIRDNDIVSDLEKMDMMLALLAVRAQEIYEAKENQYGHKLLLQAERMIMLRTIDMFWVAHLENMEHLRDSVRLRAYGQHDPLVEYKNEGHRLYQELTSAIQNHTVHSMFRIHIESAPAGALADKPNLIEKQSKENNAIAITANKNLDLGRNDPCWCGSGIKFKKCHGA
ncbi:MAG: Protein translocase subunit SecA [Parcubacteria group bacterium GW2011_GWC1_38_17]|nr:MAG: Protein translocase subunit SecA [Parcubacteria group bacterium GW2011_GWC2_36_17]KKQ43656.1 MAG: Protein translocase subunit SecA [Parcubacteria group bacterium GW2011_GWE2_37_8]KKQ58455.1 MAG: Protein translocase subunit SecA [Parcubacteria group bacterium GW2011_GWC1_38_17]